MVRTRYQLMTLFHPLEPNQGFPQAELLCEIRDVVGNRACALDLSVFSAHRIACL